MGIEFEFFFKQLKTRLPPGLDDSPQPDARSTELGHGLDVQRGGTAVCGGGAHKGQRQVWHFEGRTPVGCFIMTLDLLLS